MIQKQDGFIYDNETKQVIEEIIAGSDVYTSNSIFYGSKKEAAEFGLDFNKKGKIKIKKNQWLYKTEDKTILEYKIGDWVDFPQEGVNFFYGTKQEAIEFGLIFLLDL